MEILGEAADDGFNLEDLMRIKDYVDALGYGDMVELIDLREIATSALPKDAPEPEAAYVMVLRKFLTNERTTRIFKENLLMNGTKNFGTHVKKSSKQTCTL